MKWPVLRSLCDLETPLLLSLFACFPYPSSEERAHKESDSSPGILNAFLLLEI